jgi:hypothetical protein
VPAVVSVGLSWAFVRLPEQALNLLGNGRDQLGGEMQSTAWAKDLWVTTDGVGVVSHVGTALLRCWRIGPG